MADDHESEKDSEGNDDTHAKEEEIVLQVETVCAVPQQRSSFFGGRSTSRNGRTAVNGNMRHSEAMRRERSLMQSAEKVVKAKKQAKRSQNVALLAIGVAVLGFLAMFAVVILGNEVSKDMFPEDNSNNELKTRSGGLVTVGQATSYTTLFDLPAFDTETLAHLKQLTLVLAYRSASRAPGSGVSLLDTTLNIVSALKARGGNACTLFGSSGAKVVIDSNARTAFAIIDGKYYIVRDIEPASSRDRRLSMTGGLRLLSGDEFFTPEHGFQRQANGAVGRKLASASTIRGYAEFSISAAAGLLDYANSQGPEVYTTVYMRGTAYMLGADGTGSMSAQVYYSAANPNSSAVLLEEIGGTRILINTSGAGAMYVFNAAGILTNCSDAMPAEMTPGGALTELSVRAVNDSLTLVSEDQELGDAVFEVDYYELDPSSIPSVFLSPSGEECSATLSPPPPAPPTSKFVNPANASASIEGLIQTAINASGIDTSGRRLADLMAEGSKMWRSRDVGDSLQDTVEHVRRLWGTSTYGASSYSMWQSASGAYSGYGTGGYFTDWVECTAGNANAQFHYTCDARGCNMNLGFAGSDDISDWLQNAQIWGGGPGNHHSGFYNYQNDLKTCVNYHRNLLKSWGIPLEYIVGHSLGGAAATIYSELHGQADRGVVTFGAPKTNLNSASLRGWRFIHRDDPVPSNMCFLGCPLIGHKHVVSRVYEYYDELTCWDERVERREQEKRNQCSSTWWKFWCWFEYVWVTVTEWVRSCRWDKKIRYISNTNFAYAFSNILWSVYGMVTKHSGYGDYPSITLS
ncbi:hypothetical protein AB1Y20_021389 [Prymnesium parvum]|uniref:Fungal lipase-type domain-containing protein n=1 Tax=Prymnesium parvum TaxID=97485 RepID=A0AB34JJM3_PRYPA